MVRGSSWPARAGRGSLSCPCPEGPYLGVEGAWVRLYVSPAPYLTTSGSTQVQLPSLKPSALPPGSSIPSPGPLSHSTPPLLFAHMPLLCCRILSLWLFPHETSLREDCTTPLTRQEPE